MEHTHLIYRGQVFQIEAVVLPNGDVPAEEWLESLSTKASTKICIFICDAG
jgi:hypothetical protein